MQLEDMHIQSEDKTFLTKLYDEGEVGTNQLTQETELSKNQVHRRFRKFEESGVVITETRNPAGKHWDRETFAQLTDEARVQIQRGALGNIFTPDTNDADQEIDELKDEIEELEEQVEYLGEFVKEAEIRVKAMRWAIEESPIELDIEHYVEKLKENSD